MIHLFDLLKSKNIKVTEIPYWGIYFRNRWEERFVFHLSQLQKEEIHLYGNRYFCGYLWHVFSYDRRPHLYAHEAIQAFNEVKKAKCYIFYQHSADVILVEQADVLEAANFTEEDDVYIVDEAFTWTFVVTHERDYGPYFCKV